MAIENARLYDQTRRDADTKTVLLQEVYHRVKNNLQIVSSLLDLQAGAVEDEEAVRAFRESQNRVRSMALVHETLYRSPDLARIDMAGYIRREVEYLLAAYAGWERKASRRARVHADVHVDDVLLDIERAIPYGLIVNEPISNALKYAFQPAVDRAQDDCDEIRVKLLHSDGGLALTVSDNGIGLPVDLDWQNSTSLGLQLVHILSAQIEGRVELDRVGGTGYRITFPHQQLHTEPHPLPGVPA